MGLFDKILRDVTRAVTDSVVENKVKPEIDKKIDSVFGGNNISSNTSNYALPEKYSSFPKCVGTMIGRSIETNTEKYDRITMNFSGSVSSEFISLLEANGFRKATSVRYDNQNKYVIVEPMGSQTKIVYHIKK